MRLFIAINAKIIHKQRHLKIMTRSWDVNEAPGITQDPSIIKR